MKTQKGITLIALIITIIVMLILVGVSVSVALNTGLFSTAQGVAKNTQLEATAENELSTGWITVINSTTGKPEKVHVDSFGNKEENKEDAPEDTVMTLKLTKDGETSSYEITAGMTFGQLANKYSDDFSIENAYGMDCVKWKDKWLCFESFAYENYYLYSTAWVNEYVAKANDDSFCLLTGNDFPTPGPVEKQGIDETFDCEIPDYENVQLLKFTKDGQTFRYEITATTTFSDLANEEDDFSIENGLVKWKEWWVGTPYLEGAAGYSYWQSNSMTRPIGDYQYGFMCLFSDASKLDGGIYLEEDVTYVSGFTFEVIGQF